MKPPTKHKANSRLLKNLSNEEIFNIHSLTNHPPNVIKQIPNSIKKTLSKNFSNEEIFNTAKYEYEDALKKVGFKADFR